MVSSRTFKYLKNKIYEVKLTILADGKLKNCLNMLVEFLGLKRYSIEKGDNLNASYGVFPLRHHKNPFMFLARSTISILTSLWGGLGNAIVEAMACGTYILCADCLSGSIGIRSPDISMKSPVKDIEEGKFGILLPVPDGKRHLNSDLLVAEGVAFTEALIFLLKDNLKQEKLVTISKTRASDFDLENILNQ